MTGYVNAVAGGTAADTNNYTTSANSLFAADGAGASALDGFGAVQGFYNRALTQDEVRRLYESGVPAAGDYWSVGVNVNVGDPTTGLALTNATITSSTSTSISGINFGANNGQLQIGAGYTSKVGQKVRISFSVTGVTDPNFMYVRWVVNGLEGWYTFANAGITGSSGTFTYDFPTYYAGPQVIQIRNFASFVQNGVNITNFSARTIGLSLAPDATQSGVNLKWWDTSGNLAHITLPANGVSWNVPASGNVAVNGYEGLSLDTNRSATLRYQDNTVNKWWLYKLESDANLYLRDMSNARMHVTYSPGNSPTASSSNFASNIVCQGTLYVDSTTASMILGKTSGTALNYDIRPLQAGGSIRIRQDSATNDRYIALGRVDNVGAFTESMRVIDQNVLIGTTVNSSALLQVGTNTTNLAGGMLFGTDVGIYRSAASSLTINGSLTTAGGFVAGNTIKYLNTGIANGTTVSPFLAEFGADGTLGALILSMGGSPSATGANRFGYVAAGDNATWRRFIVGSNTTSGGGQVLVPATDVSNSTSSGALVVTGGVGIGGNTYIGGNLVVSGTITPSGGGSTTQVDTYTTTGSVLTWTKPAGAKAIEIIAHGAGGGGGGGAGNASAVLRNGGGGGGGGACTKIVYEASQVPASLYVIVGLAGTGGASQVAGVAGTNSTVASNNTNPPTIGVFARAGGGGGGGPGGITDNGGGGGGGTGGAGATSASTATSVGGAPAVAYTNAAVGGQGGGGGHTQNNGGGRAEYGGGGGGNGRINLDNFRFRGGGSMYGGGGGGSGVGLNAAGAVAGGTGGGPSGFYEGAFTATSLDATLPGGAAVAAANGTAGTAAGTTYPAGGGGGGGGGNNAGTGFTGGAGGFPAGGGGGGGASSSTGGTGGAGANGQVTIITYF